MAAPTNVAIQKYSRLRAHLTWTTSGADSYTIERRELGGSFSSIATGITASSYTDASPRSRGVTYEYRVVAINSGSPDGVSSIISTTVPSILLCMFSDSSIAFGANGRLAGGTSYCSQITGQGKRTNYQRVSADPIPDSPYLLSGKLSALDGRIETINQGQSAFYADWGEEVRNGHTPFYGEVLGIHGLKDYTFGGDDYPFNEAPSWLGGVGGIDRVNTQRITSDDWLYIQYGGNDLCPPQDPYGTVASVLGNIDQYIAWWVAAGFSKDKIILSTIPPIGNQLGLYDGYDWHPSELNGTSHGGASENIQALNNGIRNRCRPTDITGPHLLDPVDYCSSNNGLDWADQIYHVTKNPDTSEGNGLDSPWHIDGDDAHFSEQMFNRMANDILSIIQPTLVKQTVTSGNLDGSPVSQGNINGETITSRPL